VYVLRVAGVPAAAQLWCRLGDVAISIGTVYDQRMAAISPGSMSEWPVQERLFATAPPRLVDYLPGAANQLKERLGPDRPPLVRLEAARRTLVAGATFPLRRELRALHPVAARARILGRRAAARLRPQTRPQRPRVRRLEIQPGTPTLPVATLELDTPVRRFLAVAETLRIVVS
jgi:Acetyltransferase (GNAT) domain